MSGRRSPPRPGRRCHPTEPSGRRPHSERSRRRGPIRLAATGFAASALAALALAACSSAPSADFTGPPATTGSCVEDCRLRITNTSEYQVVVSAYRGNVLQRLGALSPNASATFAVPRNVSTVVAEVGNQEYCRGPVRWRADGTADFIVGGASCRLDDVAQFPR